MNYPTQNINSIWMKLSTKSLNSVINTLKIYWFWSVGLRKYIDYSLKWGKTHTQKRVSWVWD